MPAASRRAPMKARAPQQAGSSSVSVDEVDVTKLKIIALSNRIIELAEKANFDPKLILATREFQRRLLYLLPTHNEQYPSFRAPELFRDRISKIETPVEFIMRVYDGHLGFGMTRADIRRLDPQLYTALRNWIARGRALPHDFDVLLPTKAKQNDIRLDEYGFSATNQMPSEAIKALRLYHAARRRTKGSEK
jgi:hypothetical protein